MKEIRKKITSILEKIIGIVLSLCLFLGGFGLVGFIIALIAGGETAGVICTWLSKTYYVWLIKASTITTLFCFLLQYLNGNAKWVDPIKRIRAEREAKSTK